MQLLGKGNTTWVFLSESGAINMVYGLPLISWSDLRSLLPSSHTKVNKILALTPK